MRVVGTSLLSVLPLLHFAVKAHERRCGTPAAVAFAVTACEAMHITRLTFSHFL